MSGRSWMKLVISRFQALGSVVPGFSRSTISLSTRVILDSSVTLPGDIMLTVMGMKS